MKRYSKRLYYKYSDRLYNFAFRFVSDEHTAQDIVHEAYGTLWEKFRRKGKRRMAGSSVPHCTEPVD